MKKSEMVEECDRELMRSAVQDPLTGVIAINAEVTTLIDILVSLGMLPPGGKWDEERDTKPSAIRKAAEDLLERLPKKQIYSISWVEPPGRIKIDQHMEIDEEILKASQRNEEAFIDSRVSLDMGPDHILSSYKSPDTESSIKSDTVSKKKYKRYVAIVRDIEEMSGNNILLSNFLYKDEEDARCEFGDSFIALDLNNPVEWEE